MNQREWLEWRFNGIGGSDAAVVQELFPYGKTPYMLWQEKTGRIVTEETEAMRHGKKYEDAALDWFEKKKGISLWRQIPKEHKHYPWIRATIDGIDADRKFMVEAKCPYNLENHFRVKNSGKIPDIYYPQCQQQICVEELDGMYFLSYNWHDPEDSIIIEIERNDQFIENHLEKCRKFWDCVTSKQSPALTDYDYLSMDGNENWGSFALEYKRIQEKIEFYEKRKEEIKVALKSLSKDHPARGHGIELQKQDRRGFVDYTKIPELKGVNLDSYRKEGFTTWPIRVIKK